MTKQATKIAVHIPFFVFGLLVVVWGFFGISDGIDNSYSESAYDWQGAAGLLVLGGIILGVSAYSLYRDLKESKR